MTWNIRNYLITELFFIYCILKKILEVEKLKLCPKLCDNTRSIAYMHIMFVHNVFSICLMDVRNMKHRHTNENKNINISFKKIKMHLCGVEE